MSNCVFGWPIYSDPGVLYTPALSGGSWRASLPLTNAQDRRLTRVARSTDATVSSTTVAVALGTLRPVRVVALVLPNLTTAGTVRVRAYADAATLYDSGAVAVWPTGETRETMQGLKPTLVLVLTAEVYSSSWTVDIADTANPDGYVDVGRLVLAGGWQPSINMSNGARLGLETATTRDETDGGATVFNEKPRRRTLDFEVSMLPEDEALTRAHDMQRIAGTHGQMFFVFDPEDAVHRHRRSFLCVMRTLTALEHPYFGRASVPYQLVEEL